MIEFIEVKRVLSNADRDNVGTQPEIFNVADIKSARAWHKGKHDKAIKGDMTIVLLRNDAKNTPETIFNETEEEKSWREEKEKQKPKTILIEEPYQSFIRRMSQKAIVKVL